MAVRFLSEHTSSAGRLYKIKISDPDFVGVTIRFTTDSRGFALSYEGDANDNLAPLISSRLEFGMYIEDANHEAFITDLVVSAESRFTVAVYENISGSDILLWCGYIMTDIAKKQDEDYPYLFNVTATDGLARLKNHWFNNTDSENVDPSPFGSNFVDLMVDLCFSRLTELASEYFSGTDVFLRTHVNWYNGDHSTPAEAIDPLAETFVRPRAFATKETTRWKHKTCYEALEIIARHWNARIMFSKGAWHFTQYNVRADATFVERRYNKTGGYIAADTIEYEQLIDQTSPITDNGAKLAGGEYGFLPPLAKTKIYYEHNTYQNYLPGYDWEWSTDGGTAKTIPDLEFNSDTYMVLSGRVKLDLENTTFTAPFRELFSVSITASGTGGTKYFKRLSTPVANTYIIQFEPGSWETTSNRADISGNYIWSGTFIGYIDFVIQTPAMPTGTDTLVIDFNHEGSFYNTGSAAAGTTLFYEFTDIVLKFENPNGNNLQKQKLYSLTNTNVGNSDNYEAVHIFGEKIQPWTIGGLNVGLNFATSVPNENTWGIDAPGTDSFNMLAAKEIQRARTYPLQIYSGSIYALGVYAHTRISLPDEIGYLLYNGTFISNMDEWSGDWIEVGPGVTADVVIDEEIDIPGDDDKADFVKPPGSYSPTEAVNSPINSGSNIALTALATNYTDSALTGAITSIPLQFAVEENAYLANDDIFLVNPQSGDIEKLTVTATAASGATSLTVSHTLAKSFPKGSYVLYSPLNKFTGEGGNNQNVPVGTAAGQILRWNNSTLIWEPYSGVTDGHVLTWDTTNGWQAEAAPGGGVADGDKGDITVSGSGATWTIDDDAVTYAKIQNVTATNRLLGRATAGAGDIEEITIGAGLALTGTTLDSTVTAYTDEQAQDAVGTILADSATVDFTYNDATPSITAIVIDNSISDAKIRQSAGLSVIGRSANTLGNVADITAGTDAHVLRRSGTTLGFGQVATGGITDAAVTYAKIQNITATNRLLGRITAGAGVVEELTAAQAQTILGFIDGTLTATRIPFASDANTLTDDLELRWDNTNKRLSVGDTGGSPQAKLHIAAGAGTVFEGLRLASNSSNGQYFNIANANNTSGGSSYGIISVGGTSAGDPYLRFTVSGGTSWSAGVDNSDADKFRLKPTNDPSNTANKGITITNDATNRVGINKDVPSFELDNPNTTRSQVFINTGNIWNSSNIVLGAGNGTSGSVSSVSGGANFYQITWTSGTTPTANGDILTITFPVAFPTITYTVFSPRTAETATDITKMYAVTNSATQCVIRANGTITASTTFSLAFHTGSYSAAT